MKTGIVVSESGACLELRMAYGADPLCLCAHGVSSFLLKNIGIAICEVQGIIGSDKLRRERALILHAMPEQHKLAVLFLDRKGRILNNRIKGRLEVVYFVLKVAGLIVVQLAADFLLFLENNLPQLKYPFLNHF